MGKQLFTNNATGLLQYSLSSVATSLVLQPGQGSAFPNPTGGDWFKVTISNSTGTVFEIVRCTSRSSDTLNILRGEEGTTANNFAAGSKVELRITAASIAEKVEPGDSGNAMVSNGTQWISQKITPGSGIDTQVFNTSGTWTKPANAPSNAIVQIEVISGGGGGGGGGSSSGGGGGGGCYLSKIIALSQLSSSESVVVGSGGAAVSGTNQGNNGGTSSFGSFLSVPGGGGGGGGVGKNGCTGGGSSTPGIYMGGIGSIGSGGCSTTNDYIIAGANIYGGGGGSGEATGIPVSPGVNSVYGGGGGGGRGNTDNGAGGTSIFAGNGGGGTSPDGVVPGGGGRGKGGAGASGRVTITTSW